MDIAPTARLMIERVVLENFKSYAGLHQIGPFHKNFTAVVGPNGSGKSNLLECLLFAFGKRATKMRLKKLSELIHHSKAHPSLTYAAVTVYFHDIIDRGFADYEVVAGSEFHLSRTVFKSGQSKYEVNGQESSYEEVTKLLKVRGIDLEHNRFLILQGEVEQIALMKPKGTQDDEGKPVTSGLLDYLEEIIGTNVYLQQIQDAEKSIEDAHEGLAQRQNNVNQSKESMQTLEGPKNEALTTLMMEQETFQLRNLQNHMARFKHNRLAMELEAKEAQLVADKEAVEKLFIEKKEQNSAVLQQFAMLETQLKAHRQHVITLAEEYNKLEVQHTELETAQKLAVEKCVKTKGDIEKQEAKIRSVVGNVEEANAELPGTIQQLEDTAEQLRGVVGAFQDMSLEVMKKTDDLQQQRNKLMEEMRPMQAQHDSTQMKLTDLQDKLKRLTHDREEAIRQRGDLEKQMQSATERKAALANELDSLQAAVKAGNTNREELKVEMARAKSVLDELAARVAEVQGRKANFDKAVVKQQNANKIDRDIGLAIKSGKLRGVRGRLGDLGAIPAAFDVAVSSAIGKLDNYVVENVESADQLIAFAREHKLGRITAIVMEKLRKYEERNRPAIPAGASRLFDSIQCEQPDLASAFYSAFGEILVAKSLQDARNIAYEGSARHRVVTLGGDIINATGDMQGFAEPKRGKMRLIGQAEDVDMEANDFEGQLTKLEAEKQTAAEHVRKLQDDYTKVIRLSEENKAKVKAVEDDLQQWENRGKALQRELRGMEMPNTDGEVAALQAPLQKHDALLTKISKGLQAQQAQVDNVTRNIEAAGGPEYQRLKLQKQSLEASLQTLEQKVQVLKTKIMQGRKDLERANDHLEELKGKLGRTQGEVAEFQRKVDELIEKAKMIAAQITEVNTLEKAATQELEAMKNQQTALKAEFERLGEQRTSIKTHLKELKAERNKNDEEMEAWNGRILANRGKYQQLAGEFGDLMQAPGEEQPAALEVKRRHKDYSEEKKELLFPIDKEFTWNEMEAMRGKEELLQRILTFYEEKVAQAQPDLHVIKEYRERLQQLNQYQAELDATRGEVEALRLTCAEIKRKRYDEFSEGFLVISKKLREMYQMLTRGGDAELEYADSTDPFAEGIVFTVRPPKKSWKKMANLSGGEKTLSSLALVFALHHYKPTALYVMDEVDAALDFQNVSIIANYIKSRTRDAQFIIVSLRYQNFELADRLVGVYKTNDVSKTLCISPGVLSDTSSNAIIRQTVDNIRRTQVVQSQA